MLETGLFNTANVAAQCAGHLGLACMLQDMGGANKIAEACTSAVPPRARKLMAQQRCKSGCTQRSGQAGAPAHSLPSSPQAAAAAHLARCALLSRCLALGLPPPPAGCQEGAWTLLCSQGVGVESSRGVRMLGAFDRLRRTKHSYRPSHLLHPTQPMLVASMPGEEPHRIHQGGCATTTLQRCTRAPQPAVRLVR